MDRLGALEAGETPALPVVVARIQSLLRTRMPQERQWLAGTCYASSIISSCCRHCGAMDHLQQDLSAPAMVEFLRYARRARSD